MAQRNKTSEEVQFLQENDLTQYGIETSTNRKNDYSIAGKLQHEQMLKLIAKGFYKELISYGIDKKDVISVSAHLLDHLIEGNKSLEEGIEYYNQNFTLKDIKDEWNGRRLMTIEDLSISPLQSPIYSQVALWLRDPVIKYSFVSLFPDTERALKEYFKDSSRYYFSILYQGEPIGIIGADHIDDTSQKLEMRKFVGNSGLQGQGIGKRATFLFLYYSFVVMKYNKVCIYSGNTNIRNINLNSKFGFELEGVFFEDAFIGNKKRDIVRMGLLRSRWLEIFS